MTHTYKETAYHVSFVTMIGNIILSLFKIIAGIYGHSHAMISDAIHSLSDVASTIIVMIGIHYSSMQADQEHPYGHERMECIAAMILSVLLVFTGLQIGYQSFLSLFHHYTLEIQLYWLLLLLLFLSSLKKQCIGTHVFMPRTIIHLL